MAREMRPAASKWFGILGGLSLLSISVWAASRPVDSLFFFAERLEQPNPLVQYTHNSFLSFAPSALFTAASRAASSSPEQLHLVLFLLLGVCLWASFLWLHGALFPEMRNHIASAAATAGINVAGLFGLFGRDTALISLLVLVPAMITVGVREFQSSRIRLLSALLIGCWAAESAGPFALLAMSTALVVSEAARPHDRKIPIAVYAAICAPALLAAAFSGGAPFPDYPAHARVVPDDGIPGHPVPLIGAYAPLPVVDISAVRSLFGTPALLLAVSAFFCSFYGSSSRRVIHRAAFVLAVLLAIDTVLAPAMSYQMPIAALGRLLPGLRSVSLTPYLFGLALLLHLVALQGRAAAAVTILLLTAVRVTAGSCGSSFVSLPLFTRCSVDDLTALQTLCETPGDASAPVCRSLEKILRSPSAAVAQRAGTTQLTLAYSPSTVRPRSVGAFLGNMMASDREDTLPLVYDRDARTRWSPERGSQNGREWLSVRLDTPRHCTELRVRSEPFTSDFPRGLRVSTGAACDVPPRPGSESLHVIANVSDWQGRLAITPSGFPYFEAQPAVSVRIPENSQIQCLLIEQIGKTRAFDWSVSEMSLACR